ncbi:ribulose-phosphate 3-epimerase [Sodaliphilus sp.]|uniref:ribulose-phosphate 3-epimerase n=1 Tax=Sodaliphilus sp. TaxID=2815818 RepID=UPI00388EAA42
MIVSPSLLSADFAHLADDIEMLNASEAQWIHLDIMDGVFVPNISFGFPVIKSIQGLARKVLDAHLMIVDPIKYVDRVRDCGAQVMTVHYEACEDINATINAIKQAGMKAGVSIKPATPLDVLDGLLNDIDLVLIMSVNPGFGGQKFMPESIERVLALKSMIKDAGADVIIEVDGGVNETTGAQLAQAGADALVAGSYVFAAPSPEQAIITLKNL